MPNEHKKSFVLYFDAYPSIQVLPVEQKGMLLTLLFQFARETEETGVDPLTFLEGRTGLTAETQVAFCFLAETIRRDTEKWKAKQRRYQAAAARRWEQLPARKERSQPDPSDVSWMKAYIDQRDKP